MKHLPISLGLIQTTESWGLANGEVVKADLPASPLLPL